MIIDIILNEQTPKANLIENPKQWAINNKDLIQAIKDYLDTRPTAIGVASTQLSIDGKRIMDSFFIHLGFGSGDWEIAINPKMEGIGMTDIKIEGCLTWPKKWIIAEKHRRVSIEYINVDGEVHKREVRGFESQVWQHEINHLEGIPERVEKPNTEFEARQVPKIQRNDICPCGSGKKYKKCCGPYEFIETNVPRSERLLGKINDAIEKEKKLEVICGNTEDHSVIKKTD